MFPPDEPFGGFGYGGEDDPDLFPDDDRTYPYLDPDSPDWFGNEITLEDSYGELHSYTLNEWKEIVLLDAWEVEWAYGMDNLDIIYALEDAGYWDETDWEEWRVAYDRTH